jgi:hypothetical protein
MFLGIVDEREAVRKQEAAAIELKRRKLLRQALHYCAALHILGTQTSRP